MSHNFLVTAPSPIHSPMESLLSAVEIWVPNSGENHLVRADGVYNAGLEKFQIAGDGLQFVPGEGILGKTWQSKSTTVISDLQECDLPRRELALDAGLSSGLAIPVVAGDKLVAIVLLLCRMQGDSQGAVEVWRLNKMQELSIHADIYANLERFEALSRQIRFPRAAGMPGRVWDETRPLIVSNLSRSPGFARPAALGAGALEIGVGLPIMQGSLILDSVILLLSAKETPLAERFEIWMREDEDQDFTCIQTGPVPGEGNDENCQSLVQEVAQKRLPVTNQNGDQWELGLPIFVGQHLGSILTVVG